MLFRYLYVVSATSLTRNILTPFGFRWAFGVWRMLSMALADAHRINSRLVFYPYEQRRPEQTANAEANLTTKKNTPAKTSRS
jgi:hypothetical protein